MVGIAEETGGRPFSNVGTPSVTSPATLFFRTQENDVFFAPYKAVEYE